MHQNSLTMSQHPTPIQIFIAYSRKDGDYIDKIRISLNPLERQRSVKIWYDGAIVPGETWDAVIKENLHKADIILLLLSPDSLASDYFYDKEVADALVRHQAGVCKVVPVIVRHCFWETTELAHLQALPQDAKPIADWKTPDEAYKSIAVGVSKLVEDIRTDRKQAQKAAEQDKTEQERLQREREEAERLRHDNKTRREREQREQAQKAEQERLQREREKVQNQKQFWQQLKAADDLFEQKQYTKAQTAYQNLLQWHDKSEMGYTDAQPHLTQRLLQCKTETQIADLKAQARALYQQGKHKAALKIVQQALQYCTDPDMGNLQNELLNLIQQAEQQRKALLQKVGMGVVGLLLLLVVGRGISRWFNASTEVSQQIIDVVDTTQTNAIDTTQKTATQLPTPSNIDTPTKPDQPEAGTNAAYQQNVNTGNDLFVQGKYAEAKKKYEAALQLQPKSKVASANIKKCEELLKPKPSGTAPPEQTEPPKQKPIVPATTTSGSSITDPFAAQMVLIQGGTFMMGSPDSEADRKDNEYQHQVTLSSFKMSKYEVTQAQWEAIMGSNPSNFKSCPQCPVEQVSWNDIQDFLQKLKAKTGKSYRLPTEAEWEYAARGGTSTPFYTGNCLSTDQANYDGNYPYQSCAKGKYREKTTPVGSFAPNKYGLYDMHGNVWEWCQDWYDNSYYKNSPSDNPKGPSTGAARVLRGGVWYNDAESCRVANRGIGSPAHRGGNFGFRLALPSRM